MSPTTSSASLVNRKRAFEPSKEVEHDVVAKRPIWTFSGLWLECRRAVWSSFVGSNLGAFGAAFASKYGLRRAAS
jgi:hypothetical protein